MMAMKEAFLMQAPDLTYSVVRSRDLSEEDHDTIDRLLWESLSIDYPDLTSRQIGSLIIRSSRNRRDPNKAVGGRDLRAHQAYAGAKFIMAHDGTELVAGVPFANNASNHMHRNIPLALDRAAGTAERFAKLHIPIGRLHGKPLISSRYGWFGLAGFSAEVHHDIRTDTANRFTVVHGLIASAALNAHPHQPASAYPYSEELAWKKGLAGAGFIRQSDETVSPFDDGFQTRLERWTAPHFQRIMEKILLTDGGETALPRIRQSVQSPVGNLRWQITDYLPEPPTL